MDRFSDKKSIDVESVSEVLEAFREIDQKRDPEIVEYLKSCSVIGKFGVPQAKWRNGTYGINSKEPDPFYVFRSDNKS